MTGGESGVGAGSFLQSPTLGRIARITHGFGTAADPVPGAEFRASWALRPEWKQVHGTAIAEVSRPRQACGEADGFLTRTPGVPISVQTADCVPILLARRDGSAVAAIHAGWRGTKARILRELFAQLARGGAGAAGNDWVAAVGPAIGPCCYEVSPELAEEFARDFRGVLPIAEAIPRPRMLDLKAINAAELRAIGVAEVEVLPFCTRCARDSRGEPRFQSYRREGSGQRQWSAILIREP